MTASEFWFKVRGGYIYYSSTKNDINVLDAIFAKSAINDDHLSPLSNNSNSCFKVLDFNQNDWLLCAASVNTKLKWLCSLQTFLGQTLDYMCRPPSERKAANITLPETPSPAVHLKKVIQPVIIIPLASKECNEKWNYLNKGADWECTCKEGLEQSPIDLPNKEEAVLSPLRPMFQYDIVSSSATVSTYEGLLTKGDNIRIRYEKGAIKIYHPNMGKIVTLDGGVYIAEEISFHTPSEHKIDGQSLDMEMQIIHNGRSRGDVSKQVVLSLLFKKTPGIYNKFIDKLDFFNLPNPIDDYRDITQDFYIPHAFYSTDDDNISTLQPFSFYTYEGSLTMPPCSERTTHYVVSDPIPLSNTVLTLFKEALRKPDMANTENPTQITASDDGNIENNRQTQPLNGRKVFLFDHRKYGFSEYKPKKLRIKPVGHYEKIERDATEYIYVNGDSASGFPGSFLVSEKEARGSKNIK
jgi:carbonic anhydrase